MRRAERSELSRCRGLQKPSSRQKADCEWQSEWCAREPYQIIKKLVAPGCEWRNGKREVTKRKSGGEDAKRRLIAVGSARLSSSRVASSQWLAVCLPPKKPNKLSAGWLSEGSALQKPENFNLYPKRFMLPLHATEMRRESPRRVLEVGQRCGFRVFCDLYTSCLLCVRLAVCRGSARLDALPRLGIPSSARPSNAMRLGVKTWPRDEDSSHA